MRMMQQICTETLDEKGGNEPTDEAPASIEFSMSSFVAELRLMMT